MPMVDDGMYTSSNLPTQTSVADRRWVMHSGKQTVGLPNVDVVIRLSRQARRFTQPRMLLTLICGLPAHYPGSVIPPTTSGAAPAQATGS
jgi:hypothetical protein